MTTDNVHSEDKITLRLPNDREDRLRHVLPPPPICLSQTTSEPWTLALWHRIAEVGRSSASPTGAPGSWNDLWEELVKRNAAQRRTKGVDRTDVMRLARQDALSNFVDRTRCFLDFHNADARLYVEERAQCQAMDALIAIRQILPKIATCGNGDDGQHELLFSQVAADQVNTTQHSSIGVSDIFLWLTSIAGADCSHAYVWDRLLNRPRSIWHHNLWLPEFTEGTASTHSLPRDLLLGSQSMMESVIRIKPEDLLLTVPGSFCNREEIGAAIALIFTPGTFYDMPTASNRLLLFLNYRHQQDGDSIHGHNFAPTARADLAAQRLSDVVHYMNGWLLSKHIKFPPVDTLLLSAKHAHTTKLLWIEAFSADSNGALHASKTHSISSHINALLTPKTSSSSSSYIDSGTRSMLPTCLLCRADNPDDPSVLEFPFLKYIEAAETETKELPRTSSLTHLLPEKSSLSAQSLVWKQPLLFQIAKRDHSLSDKQRQLQALNISHKSIVPSEREAIAPIVWKNRSLGVLVLSSTAKHTQQATPTSLAFLEAIASLIAAANQFYLIRENIKRRSTDRTWATERQSDRPPLNTTLQGQINAEDSESFYTKQNTERCTCALDFFVDSIKNLDAWTEENILYTLSTAIRMLINAHCVHCISYDPTLGFLRPSGVSYRTDLMHRVYQTTSFLTQAESRDLGWIGDFAKLDEAIDQRNLKAALAAHLSLMNSALATSIREATGSFLTPRRNGYSWRVFAGHTATDFWDSVHHMTSRSDLPPVMHNDILNAAVVHRLRCQPLADPLGVVWFGFAAGDPAAQNFINNAKMLKGIMNVLTDDQKQSLEILINAAASIVSVLRFERLHTTS